VKIYVDTVTGPPYDLMEQFRIQAAGSITALDVDQADGSCWITDTVVDLQGNSTTSLIKFDSNGNENVRSIDSLFSQGPAQMWDISVD